MSMRGLAIPMLAGLFLTGCDLMGPEDGGRVAIRFATARPTSSASLGMNAAADFGMSSSADELVITGSNGTLTISDIRFVVSEFELERAEDACEAVSSVEEDDDEECEEFESGPFFVDLPLGGAQTVVSQEVPAGSYSELEFEVEDLDLDEEDDEQMSRGLPSLLNEIRAAGFAQWPDEASMVVVGTFTPTGGTPRPFIVFFDAEIEIELEFEPPLLVEDAARTVDVQIDPSIWFRTFGNTVLDLSAFDFATTRRIVEFEAELEGGFQKIEFDD